MLASGEVVYFIAATVVIYHLDAHSQRFYLEHNDDVKRLIFECVYHNENLGLICMYVS